MTDPLGVSKMITTATDLHGRRPAKGMRKAGIAGLLALLGLMFMGTVQAENVLEDLTYTAQPGGKVDITMRFAEAVVAPQAFTTESPPRIALDLADTRNAITQRRIEVGAGATAGISTVEAAGRTRVVVDLFRPASYETRINGKELILSIAANISGSTAAATSAATRNPTKQVANETVALSNVDFRRGKTGEGRIVVSFSGPGAAADLKREGDKIVLDILNVKLPPDQAKRLDVLDFATPVQYIETRSRGTGVRIDISAQGPFEQLAYQTGNEYVVEISPKREDEKLSKNAEPVFNGSRVTFNFQDIPTRSVLQLIACIRSEHRCRRQRAGQCDLRLINVPGTRPCISCCRPRVSIPTQAGQRDLGRAAAEIATGAGSLPMRACRWRTGRTGFRLHSRSATAMPGHRRIADQGHAGVDDPAGSKVGNSNSVASCRSAEPSASMTAPIPCWSATRRRRSSRSAS
jgi:type IV pilus assembly protein PilQ